MGSGKRLWLSLLTHVPHFTVFFGREGGGRECVTLSLPPMRAAWRGSGCKGRARAIPSLKWLSPREAEAALMWAVGSGMPTHSCAGAMGQAAQQKPLSMAVRIHQPDPAPSPPTLAQSVPHTSPCHFPGGCWFTQGLEWAAGMWLPRAGREGDITQILWGG